MPEDLPIEVINNEARQTDTVRQYLPARSSAAIK
jgi:hypothetical protein